MKKQKSQMRAVADYLRMNKTITSQEAWHYFSATRLASIIFRLREMGWDIETEICNGINEWGPYTYAKYIFIEEPENAGVSN